MRTLPLILLTAILFWGCGQQSTEEQTETAEQPSVIELPERPNILWLVAEDMSPVIAPYGDSTVQLPNIERLATEGVTFTRCFSPSGVCAPSRSSVATGMYPASIGTNHMRTGGNPDFLPEGVVPYSAVIPPEIKMHSEYLRRAGYYCSNNAKEDYQFEAPATAWDESSNQAHWRNRPDPDQPFFAIFNFGICHESGMWRNKDHELLADPEKVIVPPYYPDTELVRKEVARMYSNLVEMDRQVGEILAQLEADGELENTVIFFFGDHGGPLPRQKRSLYDSGLRIPLILRLPNQAAGGTYNDEMVNFIDFKPTLISIAGIPLPNYLHGRAFLGDQKGEAPTYFHAARDRLDTEYDRVRAVRDKRYKYVRYYEPEKPFFMPIAYREQMTLMQELHRLHDAGELEGPELLFFRETKPEEELFDTEKDPYEINNLAGDPDYQEVLERMRQAHESFATTFGDKCAVPETEMLQDMWPGLEQPLTERPTVERQGGKMAVSCATEGASIAYQWGLEPVEGEWQVYTGPIEVLPDSAFHTMAHRIGYKQSDVVSVEN